MSCLGRVCAWAERGYDPRCHLVTCATSQRQREGWCVLWRAGARHCYCFGFRVTGSPASGVVNFSLTLLPFFLIVHGVSLECVFFITTIIFIILKSQFTWRKSRKNQCIKYLSNYIVLFLYHEHRFILNIYIFSTKRDLISNF